MTAPIVRLSPALMEITRDALRICLRHYPRSPLVAVNEKSEDATLFVEDYARAMIFADYDRILEAARLWVTKEKFYPRPSELGNLALELTPIRQSATNPSDPPPPSLSKNFPVIDALYYAAKERMIEKGYRQSTFAAPIAQMWALLYASQSTPEQQETVRLGEVELDTWYTAVDLWLSGERPRSHPMNNLGHALVNAFGSQSA